MGAAVGWGVFNGKPVISRDPVLPPLLPGSRGCLPAGDLCLGVGIPVLFLPWEAGKL